jgi:hypothetical protein
MKKKTHGGKRKGAGRPLGTGTGILRVTKSVSMRQADWDRLDKKRGDQPRGAFIATKI